MLGNSIGWWEGDTLVVETININPTGGGQAAITDSGKIIERFTRYNDKQVLYEFEVHDPALYSQVWKGEVGLTASISTSTPATRAITASRHSPAAAPTTARASSTRSARARRASVHRSSRTASLHRGGVGHAHHTAVFGDASAQRSAPNTTRSSPPRQLPRRRGIAAPAKSPQGRVRRLVEQMLDDVVVITWADSFRSSRSAWRRSGTWTSSANGPHGSPQLIPSALPKADDLFRNRRPAAAATPPAVAQLRPFDAMQHGACIERPDLTGHFHEHANATPVLQAAGDRRAPSRCATCPCGWSA